MQKFSNPNARNMSRAAGGPQPVPTVDRGKPRDLHMPASGTGTGTGNKMINEKVSVPVPGTNKTQARDGGGVKSSAKGFNGGLITGKV